MSRSLRVVDPGPLSLVQDAGRVGLAHLGVPRSGWLDAPAAGVANRLVGNPEGAAVVESLLGGLVVEAGAAMAVAVTGAPCAVRVGRRPAAHGEPVSVKAGELLSLGPASAGARCYLAVSGGIEVEPVLGSRSTDTLSGVGPSPLGEGDVLPVAPATGAPSPGEAVPVRGGEVSLRFRPGPRRDWFTDDALDILAGAPYTVEGDTNRVALRLTGAVVERVRDDELPSEGLVLGSVQVPADGQPLVFLNDHPVTGGYPVVAVVDPADLPACAQLRPGDPVSFRPDRTD